MIECECGEAFLSLAEVAEVLGLATSTIASQRSRGRFQLVPCGDLGGQSPAFKRSEAEALRDAREAGKSARGASESREVPTVGTAEPQVPVGTAAPIGASTNDRAGIVRTFVLSDDLGLPLVSGSVSDDISSESSKGSLGAPGFSESAGSSEKIAAAFELLESKVTKLQGAARRSVVPLLRKDPSQVVFDEVLVAMRMAAGVLSVSDAAELQVWLDAQG